MLVVELVELEVLVETVVLEDVELLLDVLVVVVLVEVLVLVVLVRSAPRFSLPSRLATAPIILENTALLASFNSPLFLRKVETLRFTPSKPTIV